MFNIIKKMVKYLYTHIRFWVILMILNLLFLGVLGYFQYNTIVSIKDVDELVNLQIIYNTHLYESVNKLKDITFSNDEKQLKLIEKLSDIIGYIQEWQEEISAQIKEVKTIDLEDTKKYKKANLTIYNTTAGYAGSGTHIRIGNKDYILTCAHLIKDPYDNFVAIENENKETIVIDIVDYDKNDDLALFRMKKVAKHIPTIEISNEFPQLGSSVIVVGNPAMMEDTISDGIIAKEEKDRYILTNKIYFGNSGGAVLYKGKIIGVLSASKIFFDFPAMENYAIAVNLKTIQRFLEDCQL